MSEQPTQTMSPVAVAAHVKQNTTSAAIAGGLMLYFSFSGGGFILPEGDGAFEIGGRIFVYTLLIGGFCMVAAAVWSYTGMMLALLFDAVCSVIIGLLFCISAGLMLAGGGGGVLYIVFGVMFIVAGIRNGRDWANLSSADVAAGCQAAQPDQRDALATSAPEHVQRPTLADRLRQRKLGQPPSNSGASGFAPDQGTPDEDEHD